MLEIMEPTVRAGGAAIPKRYVYAFGGCSIGLNGTERVVPIDDGVDYTPGRAFQPLADLGIQSDVTVATGMLIPWDEGSGIPPGGRRVGFHSSSPCALTSGMRSDAGGSEDARGATSDQIIGDLIGEGRKVLTYRVQPAWYRGDNSTNIGARGRISARMDGGTLLPVDPVFSPSLAYSNLFSGFDPGDPAETAATEFLLKRRRSVVDLVADDTETLVNKLGAADRVRMEQHLEELRALESRIELIAPMGECMQLPDPGLDPDIGAAVDDFDYASGGAYSNEELRATVLVDLIHMAFTCDLNRSAALMFTYAQCFMNMNPLYGYASDLHEISHYAVGGGEDGANAMADCIGWHVKHWGRLVQKLRDTQEVDGSSLLEHTALVLVFEGGFGHDPEAPAEGEAHSTENMVALVAGHAGGLNAGGGQHVRATNRHPVELINTAMHAVGFEGNLGEVTGNMDDLLLG
jgi:hypothetical protein